MADCQRPTSLRLKEPSNSQEHSRVYAVAEIHPGEAGVLTLSKNLKLREGLPYEKNVICAHTYFWSCGMCWAEGIPVTYNF